MTESLALSQPLRYTEPMTTTTTHCVDVQDRRKATRQAKQPLVLDMEAIEIVMAVVGIEVGPATTIKVRITDATDGSQGYARQLGPDAFLVKVRVSKKDQYEDRHHYVVNNSLVHEMRHVAQMQQDPNHALAYDMQNKTVGYEANVYERDARAFGRLAWHGVPEAKPTPAGKPMGKALWALSFGGAS